LLNGDLSKGTENQPDSWRTEAWINEPREEPEKTLHADSAKRSHNGSSRGGKVHVGGRYSNPVEVKVSGSAT